LPSRRRWPSGARRRTLKEPRKANRGGLTATRCGRPAILALSAIGLVGGTPLYAQTGEGGVDRLLARVHTAVVEGDAALFTSAFFQTVPDAEIARAQDALIAPHGTRRVVRDRARFSLDGVSPEQGLRLVIDVFTEHGDTARLLTTTLLAQREAGDSSRWGISAVEGISSVDGLHRLRLDTAAQYEVQGLQLRAPDLLLTLTRGAVFAIRSDAGVTGLVFVGDGRMRFSPEPEAERLQVRLFAGDAPLESAFERLLVRFHPDEFHGLVDPAALRPVPVDGRTARRADAFASDELQRSYLVDIGDLSDEPWHFLPARPDLLAEIRTGRHGTLTYSRIRERAEDIALIRRDRQLTVARYTSEERIPVVGRSYNEAALRQYDVLDYDIDARIPPGYDRLQARVRLQIRALAPLTSVILRLAGTLGVYEVSSPEFGPLAFVRLREQDALVVRLPRELPPDSPLTLTIGYAGGVRSQRLDSESVQEPMPPLIWDPEPRLLLSGASYWYPQNVYADVATATLRIVAPAGATVVASGEPVRAEPDTSAAGGATADPPVATFRTDRPLRYLALLVSRLLPVETRELTVGDGGEPLRLELVANPQQRGAARNLADAAEDILRFYASIVGEAPYSSATIAVVDAELPGGHTPAYFTLLQNPILTPPGVWQRDPAAFRGFPEFFLAHELAHQWWGQAVGAQNYRERWISEGLSQYFAALYAEHAHGERALHEMLAAFRRWSSSQSDMGPISLGERLGHVRGGGRVLRALVYNKGAAVLHMLRRMVGDDVFVRGLRRFYREHQFGSAGTDDLRRAFETESGRSLERFFDAWIRGATLPRVEATSSIGTGSVTVHLEQAGDPVFELPITVSVVHRDGRVEDTVVVLTGQRLEQTIPTSGDVRRVQFNRDNAALGEIRTR
jgi:hypothetical protein